MPPHERAWRHPSEIGAHAWATTEPPIAIGRGLTATTGLIGGVLALAVLWTMLPTHAGRSAVVSVRSTVANTATPGGATASTTPGASTPSPTSIAAPATTLSTGTVGPSTTPPSSTLTTTTTLPSKSAPLPTYAVAAGATTPQVAVAVAVGNGSLVITTAAAVRKDNTVELRLPDGTIESASVMLVDQRSGFAVLAHDPSAGIESFTIAASIQPGDELSFYSAGGMSATVQEDGTIETITTDPGAPVGELPEGTPVVNQRGELVALCSHLDGEPVLVSLQHLDSLRKALSEPVADRDVWMGVVLDRLGDSLNISALDPTGPAASAGLQQGDIIRSVDNVDVMDILAIGAALSLHHPGDVVRLTVVRAGVDLQFDVTLAQAQTNL